MFDAAAKANTTTATWQTSMVQTKERFNDRDLDLFTLTDAAKFEDMRADYWLKGNVLKLWLMPARYRRAASGRSRRRAFARTAAPRPGHRRRQRALRRHGHRADRSPECAYFEDVLRRPDPAGRSNRCHPRRPRPRPVRATPAPRAAGRARRRQGAGEASQAAHEAQGAHHRYLGGADYPTPKAALHSRFRPAANRTSRPGRREVPAREGPLRGNGQRPSGSRGPHEAARHRHPRQPHADRQHAGRQRAHRVRLGQPARRGSQRGNVADRPEDRRRSAAQPRRDRGPRLGGHPVVERLDRRGTEDRGTGRDPLPRRHDLQGAS